MPEKKRYKIESAHTDDLDEAIMIAHSKAAEVKFAEAHGIDLFPHKVKDIMPDFYKYIEGRVVGGTETKPMAGLYIKIAKNHILSYFGNMSLAKITQHSVNNYFNEYIVKNDLMSQTMLNHINITLRKFLNFAQEMGWYKHQPIPRLEKPKGIEVGIRGCFTDSEIETMLSNIDKWVNERPDVLSRALIRFLIHFMLATGARTNDLQLLRWKHCRYENEDGLCIDMDDHIEVIKGKEVHVTAEHFYHMFAVGAFSNAKSGNEKVSRVYMKVFLQGKKRPRWVACDPSVTPHYWIWKQISHHPRPDDLVFSASPKDKKKVFFLMYTVMFNEFLEYCEIPKKHNDEDRSAYSLRHTFITKKLKEGAGPFDIANMCGTSVREIEKTYCHMLPSDVFKRIFKPNQELTSKSVF